MKVVLFCGGYGLRMRESPSDDVPKPMARIGGRPLLWHVMRWYAHWGHREFVLCLGYGAEQVKNFFLDYRETSSNDFVLREGEVSLLDTDVSSWTITFVDTGLRSSIGERLLRVGEHLQDERMFLANYGDVLTDVHLPTMVGRLESTGAAAALLAVPPVGSFHVLDIGGDDRLRSLRPVADLTTYINGGYFVLTPRVLADLAEHGGDLVDALDRLAGQGLVLAHRHDGFWLPADTVKERSQLEAMYGAKVRPWAVWEATGVAPNGSQPDRAGEH